MLRVLQPGVTAPICPREVTGLVPESRIEFATTPDSNHFGGDLASTGATKQAGHAEGQLLVNPLESQI